jgi:hypothetical protein
MTGAGITLYLLYLQNYMLAAINLAVFAPLITFHFVMTAISKSLSLTKEKTMWLQVKKLLSLQAALVE